MKYSSSAENHIKAIFHLQKQDQSVTTNELAATLQTRPASVTDMLKKLKRQKLLNYEKYKGFRLSAEGKRVALQIIRKHRLWEYFLVEKLKFGWDEVHEIAEELEHISSRKLIDRLDEYLEFPKTDPHGDPIPDSSGHYTPMRQVTLSDLPVKKWSNVTGIRDQSPEMLDLLRHQNIHLGTKVYVKKVFAFDRSLEIKLNDDESLNLSAAVAQNILVQYEE